MPKISQKARRMQLQLDRMLDAQTDPVVGVSRELDERLRGYQRRAVAHLQNHPRAALFMEMGL